VADCSTIFMGLQLSNPLVVASCSLTKSLKGIKKCVDAGAGAVVLKSLFEEQITADAQQLEHSMWIAGHSEAIDYVRNISRALGPKEYLTMIEKAKKATSIPIIASLNCISAKGYLDFARQIESAGADGLELNISIMPVEPEHTSESIEHMYLDVVDRVCHTITIPVAVKIGPYFTSLSRMAHEICNKGAKALVFFNRFFHPDIDIDKIALMTGYRFSSPDEMSGALRWIALLAGRVSCDFAASTGVHDGLGAIKHLLAGATIVQVCSVLYLKGISHIQTMLEQLLSWMDEHNYSTLEQFRGRLSQKESDRPELYERLQYIKTFVDID